MDFLKIRKKAQERSAERAAAKPADRDAPAKAPEGKAVVTDADVLEGELVARLQGLPPVPSEAPATDARFTTWRPGSGAPPRVDAGPPELPPPPTPREEDFTVVTGLASGAPKLAPPAALAPPEARRAPQGDPLDEFFYRPDEEAPSIPALGAHAAEPAPPDDPDMAIREEYLTFLLGGEEYAVAIERVREVLKAPPITEVPRAPAHIVGVVTVRGEVVAVFDPRRRLGLPGSLPEEGAGRVVIVDAGDGPCGLLVDAVASVVRLRPGSIEPCPQGIGGASAECLAGIGRVAERLFTVLDLGALLRRPSPPARRAGEEDRHARA